MPSVSISIVFPKLFSAARSTQHNNLLIMHSIRHLNRSAAFWDLMASLEEQDFMPPPFGSRGESDNDNELPAWSGGWPFGRVPHRSRLVPPPPPPPPPPADPNSPPPPPPGHNEDDPSERRGSGPGSHRGRHGPGRRSGCHGRGSRGSRYYDPQLCRLLTENLRSPVFGEEGLRGSNDDFKPEADVFDASESFVVHVALPGARKEHVGVHWDAEKSELSIAGVIHRSGDEEFLKTLALDERRIGAFDRKIRLGSRASPAQVDADGISAKFEDGILIIEVPKLDSGYVEIKKVDIE